MEIGTPSCAYKEVYENDDCLSVSDVFHRWQLKCTLENGNHEKDIVFVERTFSYPWIAILQLQPLWKMTRQLSLTPRNF